MTPAGKVELLLVYRWNNRDILIGDTCDPGVLALVKERILETASAQLDALRSLDPIIRIDAECQLRRKQKALDLLVPRYKGRAIKGNGDGAKAKK